MKKNKQILFLLAVLTILFVACTKPYEPAIIKSETNFLVIDGIISCGNDVVTTITLSRTKSLYDSILFAPEWGAQVFIIREQGGTYSLTEQGNGIYSSAPLDLDPSENYRLKVIASGKEYLSEWVTAKATPAIDSITWKQSGDVTISVHTHDPTKESRYYRWEYNETWNYSSQISGVWGVKDGLIFLKDSTTQTDSCWRTANSTNILIGTSIALSEDVISNFPLTTIPQHHEKIGKGYSILVRQYALEEDAFRYLQLIQKNTQQLGTLFDAQPSQLTGNFISSEPGEPVIGFISASTITEKRIFIQNSQLTDWNYHSSEPLCGDVFFIPQNPTNYLIFDFPDPSYAPYYFVTGGGLAIIKKSCLDCRERGGTSQKPSFW